MQRSEKFMKIGKKKLSEGMDKKIWIFAFLFSVFVILPNSLAINLGSSAITPLTATVNKGESYVFRFSLFTLSPKEINLRIRAVYPEDLVVIISPPQVSLKKEISSRPYSCSNCVWIAYGDKYIKAIPVDVYVKVPPKISTNVYKVKLYAEALSKKESLSKGFYQQVIPSFQYEITLKVRGIIDVLPEANISKVKVSEIKINPEKYLEKSKEENVPTVPTGFLILKSESNQQNNLMYLLIVVGVSLLIIVIIALIIKRRRRKIKYFEKVVFS